MRQAGQPGNVKRMRFQGVVDCKQYGEGDLSSVEGVADLIVAFAAVQAAVINANGAVRTESLSASAKSTRLVE